MNSNLQSFKKLIARARILHEIIFVKERINEDRKT